MQKDNNKADSDLKTRGKFLCNIRVLVARVFRPVAFTIKPPVQIGYEKIQIVAKCDILGQINLILEGYS